MKKSKFAITGLKYCMSNNVFCEFSNLYLYRPCNPAHLRVKLLSIMWQSFIDKVLFLLVLNKSTDVTIDFEPREYKRFI